MSLGVEELHRIVAAVTDRALAAGYVRGLLRDMEPGDAGPLVDAIIASAAADDARATALLMIVSLALASPDGDEARLKALDEARSIGLTRVLRLFAPRGPAREEGDDPPPIPDFGRGRPLTLGERKSVARSRDRQLLARVVRDPHPDVIRILLGNPTLTEADVVRLCARRPIPTEVLREVFRSPRWLVRRGVQLALIKNPWLPLDLGHQLLPHIGDLDRRVVATSPELSGELRAAASGALAEQVLH